MNILHISNPVCIPVKGYGGTERVVYSLAKKQGEKGHYVTLIAGKPSAIEGVEDASFAEGRTYDEGRFIIRRFGSLYSLKAILKGKSGEFDIIHNHISEEAITYSSVIRKPFLTTLHCAVSIRSFWPFVTTAISSILPRTTKFATISKRAFESYRPFYRRALMSYVHNGFDLERIPFNAKSRSDHEISLAFLGKLIPEKYPHIAIQVANILADKGVDVILNLMGKLDNPVSSYGRSLIEACKRRSYVNLQPNISTAEMYKVLMNSDVLLSPSYEIGLITSQLESMATGTPVVGFLGGSATETVVEGVNGFLAKDKIEMAEKCIAALGLSRANCRKFVEDNFSDERMYSRYNELYHRIASS